MPDPGHEPLTESRIAALYVEPGGAYYGLENVDPWDAERDARNYAGPYPVIAHPPCNTWSQLANVNHARWGTVIGDDGGTFAHALDAVRRWGGVLEHPAYSMAWRRYGLPAPVAGAWTQAFDDPGMTTELCQSAYGHDARKRTWLYAVGVDPLALDWRPIRGMAVVGAGIHSGECVGRGRSLEPSRTPPAFRDTLIALARTVQLMSEEPLIQSCPVPYYDEDGISIYHGDCREVLPLLSDVDLVFTSPPYNLGDTSGGLGKDGFNTYDTHDDTRMSDADYEAHQRAVLSACWATLSPTGAIFYNHKPVIRDRVVALPTRLNPDLPLRQIIVWYRQMGVNWSANHFLPVHEWIMVLAKPDWTLRDKTASHASDVWMIRPDMAENEHPCPFPLALPLKAIQATNATLVLDPFMGSGTTLRAAADLGLRAIGIDVSERYCELAVRRLAQRSLFAMSMTPEPRLEPLIQSRRTP